MSVEDTESPGRQGPSSLPSASHTRGAEAWAHPPSLVLAESMNGDVSLQSARMLNQAPEQCLAFQKCHSVLMHSHPGKFLDFVLSAVIYCVTYARSPCDGSVYMLLNCTVFFANTIKEVFKNTNVTELSLRAKTINRLEWDCL